jgi:hypothetical protein
MKPADVTSALAARRTVRVTYSRSADTYTVSFNHGDQVVRVLATIHGGYDLDAAADLATTVARKVAQRGSLDVTEVDVP